MIRSLFALSSLVACVLGDVYLHNPRGSNDRNCERNANRDNGNRLFDSQNNNAGGYACQRAVGGPDMQNEMGERTFRYTTDSGVQTFTQSKRMYYYEGSVLPIEWTNQHGCGYNSKLQCEIVLQYACEDTLDPRVDNFWPWVTNKAGPDSTYYGTQHFRNGQNIGAPRDGVPRDSNDAATDTIPDLETSAIADPATETTRFGMHESYDQYQLCQRTERNRGLYTADQNLRRTDRRGTRQNPNGNRQGLECPEERDYYPWWAPSPWVDIAVLSDQAKPEEICLPTSTNCSVRCAYYQQNTMNFNSKGYCDVDHNTQPLSAKISSSAWNNRVWYNNNASCYKAGFRWYQVSHSDNLNLAKDFVCARTHFSRTNQLGNAMGDIISETNKSGIMGDHVVHGVNANRFIWQIPAIPTMKSASYFGDMESAYKSCSLRLRYNVSTGDFPEWPSDANSPGAARMVDYRNNSKSYNDPNTPILQDPYVYIGNSTGVGDNYAGEMFLSLAVNTNQYGRTFQDRTYSFSIKKLTDRAADNKQDVSAVSKAAVDANLRKGGRIYNVNVRGKRGNIVQTFPSVEYDFAPNALKMTTYDMIHFQWSGSDYNPRRGCNNAEGGPPDLNTFFTATNADLNSRADRSNVVMQDSMSHNVPKDYLGFDPMNNDLSLSERRTAHMDAVLANAPCYNPSTSTPDQKTQCYDLLMRLAFLNQQQDTGSLLLRQSMNCLTQSQIDAILDQENTAQNHPLNCAKLNAKPFPYFDAGIMMMAKKGWFPFYSSRNNNFSNRDQKGIICVGNDVECPTNSINGLQLLQQPATYLTGAATKRMTKEVCTDTLNSGSGANTNGAHSCITVAGNASLTRETFTIQEGDSDNKGDGNRRGCEVLSNAYPVGTDTIEQQVVLAIILLCVGLFVAWLAYFLYNRWQRTTEGEGKFRDDKAWTGAGILMGINPFKKVPNNEAIV